MADDLRAESHGCSVYMDQIGIATASDPAAAELIALAINYVGLPQSKIPLDAQRRLAELTR